MFAPIWTLIVIAVVIVILAILAIKFITGLWK